MRNLILILLIAQFSYSCENKGTILTGMISNCANSATVYLYAIDYSNPHVENYYLSSTPQLNLLTTYTFVQKPLFFNSNYWYI